MPISLNHINWDDYLNHPRQLKKLQQRFQQLLNAAPNNVNHPVFMQTWYQYRYLTQLFKIEKLPIQILKQLNLEFKSQNDEFPNPILHYYLFFDIGLLYPRIIHLNNLVLKWVDQIDPQLKIQCEPALTNYLHQQLNHITMLNLQVLHQFKINAQTVNDNSLTQLRQLKQMHPYSKSKAIHQQNIQILCRLKQLQIYLSHQCRQQFEQQSPHVWSATFEQRLFERFQHQIKP